MSFLQGIPVFLDSCSSESAMAIRNFSELVHLLKLWRDTRVPTADGRVLFISVCLNFLLFEGNRYILVSLHFQILYFLITSNIVTFIYY